MPVMMAGKVAMDSVWDRFHDADTLVSTLNALGMGIHSSNVTESTMVLCPNPAHNETRASAALRFKDFAGVACQSSCVEDFFHISKVICFLTGLRTAGDAALWAENFLGLDSDERRAAFVESSRAEAKRIERICYDPSLTVAQYLAMKRLPEWIAERFDLRDVQVYCSTDKDPAIRAKGDDHFESGWYSAVLMPSSYADPRTGEAIFEVRSRARTTRNMGNIKPVSKWRGTDGIVTDEGSSGLNLKMGAYGLQQLAGCAHMPRSLIVVEGESDVHSLHAAGITNVIGIPGASNAGAGLVPDMINQALSIMGVLSQGGDPARVIVWSEPGVAGERFPARVRDAVHNYPEDQTHISVVAIESIKATGFDDPSQGWMQMCDADQADQQVVA